MKIDFKKIDLRQGKYWFPLVLFVRYSLSPWWPSPISPVRCSRDQQFRREWSLTVLIL